ASERRHTSSKRDWSSDVCSSDLFHRAIARATHNEFMDRLMPVIFQAINQGVILSKRKEHVVEDTIRDHRLIMDFMKARNAEGARNAMRIHILHAMQDLGME